MIVGMQYKDLEDDTDLLRVRVWVGLGFDEGFFKGTLCHHSSLLCH